MFRITATPMEGSEADRVFHSELEPVWVDGLLRFIAHPMPRNVRLPAEEVLEVEDLDAPADETAEDESAEE